MSQNPYSINISKGTSSNTMEISGSLIINHIESIYTDLKGSLDFSKKHIIKLVEVESIDLTFIQMLLSLKKEFANYGTDFEIKLDLTEEHEALLKNSGFETQFHN